MPAELVQRDRFGVAMALSGTTAIFSASYDTDNKGAAYVYEITPPTGSQAPLADAGGELTAPCAAEGGTTTVTLDGTLSSDPGGNALTYRWYQWGSEIATGATPSVELANGTHMLTLTVDNGLTAPAHDMVVVTVCPPNCPSDPHDACTPECPCSHGGADCDSNDDCTGGARCLNNVGEHYGYKASFDVCVADCPDWGVGGKRYCTPGCPCDDGEGDCDGDEECVAGTRCLNNVGEHYGFSDPTVDVCVAGCPDVGSGGWNFCTAECPCDAGEGDCDYDGECAGALVCKKAVGADYGFDPSMDVCAEP
jgi:hypothetical protein